jgi:hypothetical protein
MVGCGERGTGPRLPEILEQRGERAEQTSLARRVSRLLGPTRTGKLGFRAVGDAAALEEVEGREAPAARHEREDAVVRDARAVPRFSPAILASLSLSVDAGKKTRA